MGKILFLFLLAIATPFTFIKAYRRTGKILLAIQDTITIVSLTITVKSL
jgi:hypothetical protein